MQPHPRGLPATRSWRSAWPTRRQRIIRIAAVAHADASAGSGGRFATRRRHRRAARYREKRTVNVADVPATPTTSPLVARVAQRGRRPHPLGRRGGRRAQRRAATGRAASTASEVITLETLADGIGIMLRNAELYQALERTNAQARGAGPHEERAREHRGPRLPRAPGRRARPRRAAGMAAGRPARSDRLEQARAIIHAATHMANLVEKTLKTTRLETGQFPFDFGLVDLAAAAARGGRALPARAMHPLVVEMPEDPVPCWADRDRIAEVLDNLLSNAVKYSPAGGEPCASRSRRDDERRWSASATRGSASRTATWTGCSGPSRACATAHRGHRGLRARPLHLRSHRARARRAAGVETAPGKGSVFSFTVPALRRRRPDAAAADPGGGRATSRRGARCGGWPTSGASPCRRPSTAWRRSRPPCACMPAAVVLDRILPKLRRGRGGRPAARQSRHPARAAPRPGGRGGARRPGPALRRLHTQALVQEHLGGGHGQPRPAPNPLTSPGWGA